MDASPFRARKLFHRPNSVEQRASPISPLYTPRSSDQSTSQLTIKLSKVEEAFRNLEVENQQLHNENRTLKAQLTQAWEELSSASGKSSRLDTSPRREGDYDDQLRRLKSERNSSNERYKRQVARCSALLRENEDLKTKLACEQALHFEDLTSRKYEPRSLRNLDIARSTEFRMPSTHLDIEKLKKTLEARITTEDQRLQHALKKLELHVSGFEEDITKTVKQAETSMIKVNSKINAKNRETQTLRLEIGKLKDQLHQATQDLTYKEQELSMTNADHDIEVVRLKEDLALIKAQQLKSKLSPSEIHQLKEMKRLEESLDAAEITIQSLIDNRKEQNSALSSLELEYSKVRALATQKTESERFLRDKCEALELSLNKLRKDYSALAKHNLEQQKVLDVPVEITLKSPYRPTKRDLNPRGSTTDRSEVFNKFTSLNHKLKDEVGELKLQVETYKDKAADLRKQNEEMQASALFQQDIDDLLRQERDKAEQLEMQVGLLEYELEKSCSISSQQASLIDELQTQLEELKASRSDLENEELRSRVSQLKAAVTQLDHNCTDLANNNEQLRNTIEAVSAERDALRTHQEITEHRLKETEQLLAQQRIEKEAESVGRTTLLEDRASLERLLDFYKESQENMRVQITEAKDSYLLLQSDLDIAKSEVAQYKDLTKEADAKAMAYLQKLEVTTVQITEAIEAKQAALKDLRSIRDQMKTEKETTKAANERIKVLTSELEGSKAQNDKTREVREKVLADLKHSKEQIKALKAQLITANQRADGLAKDLDALTAAQREVNESAARELKLATSKGKVAMVEAEALATELRLLQQVAAESTESSTQWESDFLRMKLMKEEADSKLELSERNYTLLSEEFKALDARLALNKTATLENQAILKQLEEDNGKLVKQLEVAHSQNTELLVQVESKSRVESELRQKNQQMQDELSETKLETARVTEKLREADLLNADIRTSWEQRTNTITLTYENQLKAADLKRLTLEGMLTEADAKLAEANAQLEAKELPNRSFPSDDKTYQDLGHQDAERHELQTAQAQVKLLSEKAATAASQLIDLQANCSTKQQKIDELTHKAELSKGAIHILNQQIDDMHQLIHKLRTDKADTEKTLEEIELFNTDLTSQVAELTETNGLLQEQADIVAEQLLTRDAKIDELQIQNASLANELKQLQQETQEELHRMGKVHELSLAVLTCDCELKQQELDATALDLKTAQDDLQSLQETVIALESEISQLKEEVEIKELALSSYEGLLSEDKANIVALRLKIQEQEATIDAFFQKFDLQAAATRALESQKTEADSTIMKLQSDEAGLRKQYDDLKTENERLLNKLARLKQAQRQSESKHSLQSEELANLSRDVSKHAVELEAVKEDSLRLNESLFASKDAQVQALMLQSAEENRKCAELNETLLNLMRDLADNKATIAHLQVELKVVREQSRHDQAEAQLERLGRLESLRKLEAELQAEQKARLTLEADLKQHHCKIDELDLQNQQLNEQLTQQTTSLTTEEVENIQDEVERLELNAKQAQVSSRRQSYELEVKERHLDTLELALSQAQLDKVALESQLIDAKTALHQQEELIKRQALEAKSFVLKEAAYRDQVELLEADLKSLQRELTSSERRLQSQSDMPNSSIMYNALKKAIELKGQENVKLEHLLEKATIELNEVRLKASRYKSRNKNLSEDLHSVKLKYAITEEERVRSACASDGLESKLSDAEFQVLMYKNALKQKEIEVQSLNSHCEEIELQVEKYQRAVSKATMEGFVGQEGVNLAINLLTDFDVQVEKVSGEWMGSATLVFEALTERVAKLGAKVRKGREAYRRRPSHLGIKLQDYDREQTAFDETVAQIQTAEGTLQQSFDDPSSCNEPAEISDLATSGLTQDISSDQVETHKLAATQPELITATLESLQDALSDARIEKYELKTKLAALQEDLKKLQDDNAVLTATCTAKDEALQQLTGQLAIAEETIKTLKLDVERHIANTQSLSDAEQALSKKIDEVLMKARQTEDEKRLVESQLQGVLGAITGSKKLDLSQLLQKNQDLETEVRRLRNLEDHCDELELKAKSMAEKVKVLMIERADSQRLIKSIATDHKRELSLLADSLDLKSKHTAQLTAELDSLKKQKDDLHKQYANEVLTQKSNLIALTQEYEASMLKVKELEGKLR